MIYQVLGLPDKNIICVSASRSTRRGRRAYVLLAARPTRPDRPLNYQLAGQPDLNIFLF
jgi:hypothetical protein